MNGPVGAGAILRSATCVLVLAAVAGPALATPPDAHSATDIRRVIAQHADRYPAMEIADLYKLVHQAALGSAHAVTDPAAARQWLEREIATLDPVEGEPLHEPLSPDGRLVRVNLRPYLAGGGATGRLAAAFVESAKLFQGSHSRLRSYWSVAVEMAREGELPFDAPDLERHLREAESSGYPPVHHSTTYRELYTPAYRIVLRALIEGDQEHQDAASLRTRCRHPEVWALPRLR